MGKRYEYHAPYKPDNKPDPMSPLSTNMESRLGRAEGPAHYSAHLTVLSAI